MDGQEDSYTPSGWYTAFVAKVSSWQCRAVQCRVGQGRAGQGRAGQGRAGQGSDSSLGREDAGKRQLIKRGKVCAYHTLPIVGHVTKRTEEDIMQITCFSSLTCLKPSSSSITLIRVRRRASGP